MGEDTALVFAGKISFVGGCIFSSEAMVETAERHQIGRNRRNVSHRGESAVDSRADKGPEIFPVPAQTCHL